MIYGGQRAAVQPAGLGVRRKPRHLQMMEAQRGQATAGVVAQKERQRQEEEDKFNRQQSEKSLALQQQQTKQQEKNYETQKKISYGSAGISLLNTVLGFFS